MFKLGLILTIFLANGWADELPAVEDVTEISTILEQLETEEPEINNVCVRDLWAFYVGLMKGEDWAIAMFDSVEKLPSGSFRKVINGKFNECVEIVHSNFTGRRCLVDIRFGLDSNSTLDRGFDRVVERQFSYGICVPSTCESKDLKAIFDTTKLSKYLKLEMDEMSCITGELPTLRTMPRQACQASVKDEGEKSAVDKTQFMRN